MSAAKGTKNSADSCTVKKCKPSSLVVKDVCYNVIKEHHLYRWLRQERMLKITLTHIQNCNPLQEGEASPQVKKHFPLTSIVRIKIKGEKSFYFHVYGDHTYYYYTPRAIEIALKIQRYVASANAVNILLGAEDERKNNLMKQLVSGLIPLPGSYPSDRDGAYTYHSPRLVRLRCKISRALRNGEIDGSDELRNLARIWKAKSKDDDDMDLFQLRQTMNIIKEKCSSHMLDQLATSSRETYAEIAMCVEDIFQRIVIQPNFDKIMSFLRRNKVLIEREAVFNRQRELLRSRAADIFNIPHDLRLVNYKLALRHFDLLTNFRSPNDLLDQVANIAACIYLTVYVAVKFPRKTRTRGNTNSSSVDDPINVSVESNQSTSFSQIGNALIEKKTAVMSIECEGPRNVVSRKSENNDILTSLMLQLQTEKVSTKSFGVANCSAPVTLSIDQEQSLSLNHLNIMNPQGKIGEEEITKTLEEFLQDVLPDEYDENNDIIINPTQLFLNPELVARVKKGGLSADEIIPLFIYLLCKTDIYDMCIIVHFIELLRDPADTSERAYYFTTLVAAISMVCDWKE